MTRRFRPRALAAALALAFAAALSVVAVPAAQADTSTCSGTGTIAAGAYEIQANEWNSSAQQCITYTSGTAWSVSTANFNLATNGALRDFGGGVNDRSPVVGRQAGDAGNAEGLQRNSGTPRGRSRASPVLTMT